MELGSSSGHGFGSGLSPLAPLGERAPGAVQWKMLKVLEALPGP